MSTSGAVRGRLIESVRTGALDAKQDVKRSDRDPVKVLVFDHSFASMAIYGSLAVMAVLVAMDDPQPLRAAAELFGVTLAIAVAKGYSEFIANTVHKERKLNSDERRQIFRNVSPVVFGAQGPTIVMLLSALGLMPVDAAIEMSKALVLLLLFAYGFRVAQLLHKGCLVRFASGLIIMSAGLVVVLINYLVH